MEDLSLYPAVDLSTGKYLPSPWDTDLLQYLRNHPIDTDEFRDLIWWAERYGLDDPEREPMRRVEPNSLASAGWSLVIAPDIEPEVEEALRPLITLRQSQMGGLTRIYKYRQGQTKADFLRCLGASPGPADPKFLPYYVLLVGSPQSIPFRFQYELDVQYAVGRIFFEKPDEYANYAKGVCDAEAGQVFKHNRGISFFGVEHEQDRATRRTSQGLIKPLADALEAEDKWRIERFLRKDAVKANLLRLMGGEATPALLFAAAHGAAFLPRHPRQTLEQGALVCQDWPGPSSQTTPVHRDHYFSAEDIPEEADVRGLVVFLFACFSAGTPKTSDFYDIPDQMPQPVAERDFLSKLAQRLLGHPRGGALAVLGHIDRAWTSSFSWTEEGQVGAFVSALQTLLDGSPAGMATEYLNQQHAELTAEFANHVGDFYTSTPPDPLQFRQRFNRLWRASRDARNFILLGDPAVRLAPTG